MYFDGVAASVAGVVDTQHLFPDPVVGRRNPVAAGIDGDPVQPRGKTGLEPESS